MNLECLNSQVRETSTRITPQMLTSRRWNWEWNYTIVGENIVDVFQKPVRVEEAVWACRHWGIGKAAVAGQ